MSSMKRKWEAAAPAQVPASQQQAGTVGYYHGSQMPIQGGHPHAPPASQAPPCHNSTRVVFGVEVSPAEAAEYGLVARIVGADGSNFKYLTQRTGARILLRGRCSGHTEAPLWKEADEPLQIFVQCENEACLKDAVALAENLLESVRKDYTQWAAKQNKQKLSEQPQIQQYSAPAPAHSQPPTAHGHPSTVATTSPYATPQTSAQPPRSPSGPPPMQTPRVNLYGGTPSLLGHPPLPAGHIMPLELQRRRNAHIESMMKSGAAPLPGFAAAGRIRSLGVSLTPRGGVDDPTQRGDSKRRKFGEDPDAYRRNFEETDDTIRHVPDGGSPPDSGGEEGDWGDSSSGEEPVINPDDRVVRLLQRPMPKSVLSWPGERKTPRRLVGGKLVEKAVTFNDNVQEREFFVDDAADGTTNAKRGTDQEEGKGAGDGSSEGPKGAEVVDSPKDAVSAEDEYDPFADEYDPFAAGSGAW